MVNKISGISVLILGIILVAIGIFSSLVFLIYGGILTFIAIFILLNSSEDKIEQIIVRGGNKNKK